MQYITTIAQLLVQACQTLTAHHFNFILLLNHCLSGFSINHGNIMNIIPSLFHILPAAVIGTVYYYKKTKSASQYFAKMV
jgi:hypothetical protein